MRAPRCQTALWLRFGGYYGNALDQLIQLPSGINSQIRLNQIDIYGHDFGILIEAIYCQHGPASDVAIGKLRPAHMTRLTLPLR